MAADGAESKDRAAMKAESGGSGDLCSTDTGTSFSSANGSERFSSSEVPAEEKRTAEVEEVRSDPRCTNLNHFHSFADFDQIVSTGQFTMMKHISACCRGEGKVELHSRGPLQELVVVKRLPLARVTVNKEKPGSEHSWHQRVTSRDAEDPLAEIGVFTYLSRCQDVPEYLLQMHVAFTAGADVWLVIENAVQGDLFSVVQSGCPSIQQTMMWMWQLLQAVKFMHSHAIGHRDISLENILLAGGDVRLMDFGQAVQTHGASGDLLRYFIAAGKPYYRAPECYIPNQTTLEVVAPPCSLPDQIVFAQGADYTCHVRLPSASVPAKSCLAEPYGYPVKPMDLFACAVSVVIMATGSPPWRQARHADGHFKWVQANGVGALTRAWGKSLPAELCDLMDLMLKQDPGQRPVVEDCLAHHWFEPLHARPVAVRNQSGGRHTSSGNEHLATVHVAGLMSNAPPLAGDCYADQELVCRGSAMDLDFFVPADTKRSMMGGDALSYATDQIFGDPYSEMMEASTWRGDFLPSEAKLDDKALATAPKMLPLIRKAKDADLSPPSSQQQNQPETPAALKMEVNSIRMVMAGSPALALRKKATEPFRMAATTPADFGRIEIRSNSKGGKPLRRFASLPCEKQ